MKLMFLIVLTFVSALRADDIIIVNNTLPEAIWAAVYQQKGDAKRTAGPQMIPGNSKIEITRPSLSFGYDRELAFDYTQNSLQPTIGYQQFKEIPHTNIGYKHGLWKTKPNFYIAKKEGRIKGYGAFDWNVWKPVKVAVGVYAIPEKVQVALQHTLPAIKDNPYKNQQATVRQGNELCAQERAYLAARGPKARRGLEQFLDRSLDGKYVPKIAIVGSGGGYRAMLCTLGSLIGAQKIGLLDATTYISALSGSTWAVGGWLSHQETIEEFKFALIPKLIKRTDTSMPGLVKGITQQEASLIAQMLLTKMAFAQPITLVDLYGAFLANSLFSDFDQRRQLVHLSDQAARIQSGDLPFPIYTAVRGESAAGSDWYEFTPYEIGATWKGSGMYVPTWAYGRKFVDGKSVDFAPEQSMGYFMGTWGSAFAARFDQLYQEAAAGIQNVTAKTGVDFVVTSLFYDLGHKRITKSWAEALNFSVGLSNSPVRERKVLKLVDAGAFPGFNLPYPPISGERPERQADVMIFLDASADDLALRMKQVEQYARAKNLKFPQINYDGIDKRAISIFKNEQDPTVPVVIYMPRIKDDAVWKENKSGFPEFAQLLENFDVEKCIAKEFCRTLNFEYEPHESSQLSALTEFNMRASRASIENAINWVIDKRSLR